MGQTGTELHRLGGLPRAVSSVKQKGWFADVDLIWPNTVIIGGLDADAFIMQMLAAGNKPSIEEPKRPPGTPIKKVKANYFGGNRPWQSAVANKVGFHFGDLGIESGGQAGPGRGGKLKNGPRKSLPAAFPHLGEMELVRALTGSDSEDDDENISPSSRRDGKYMGLGLGQPPAAGPVSRTRWLMRRSSSGTFSSGSETSVATPTRRKGTSSLIISFHRANYSYVALYRLATLV